MYELQKASLLKRISAFLLDFILMTIAVTGFAFLISVITGYDQYSATVTEKRAYYEELYAVDFDIAETEEEFKKLPIEQQNEINTAFDAFANDEKVLYAYNMMFNLTLTISTIGTLLAYLLLEFFVPLFLKNGQTVGKKIFGIGVMHVNGIRLNNVALFSRTLLGKYTIETMIPVIVLTTMLFGGAGIVGLIVLGLILLLEIFVFFKEGMNTPIHDVLGHTVTVDLGSQMIFDTEEELVAYKNRRHAESISDL